jgi:hypothetical protein
MMAKGLVLCEVPLLCGDEPPAGRGQAPRWSHEKWGAESVTPAPIFQVQAFDTEPAPG